MASLFDDFDAIYAQQSPDAIRYDFRSEIEKAVRQVALSITAAQDDKLKDLFEECFQAGRENASTPAIYAAPDFEEWWDALIERLRKELDET